MTLTRIYFMFHLIVILLFCTMVHGMVGTRPIFLERGTVDAYEQRSKLLEDESFSWFRLKSRERRDARWALLEGDALQLIVATDGRALHLSNVVAHVPYNYFIVIASPDEIRALRERVQELENKLLS